MGPRIQVRRVYEPATPTDETRILVDRLWPRGLTKERAAVDVWLKEIAPTTGLRKWFDHDADKWNGFQARYEKELQEASEPWERLVDLARSGPVTLLYATRETARNHAVFLADRLRKILE